MIISTQRLITHKSHQSKRKGDRELLAVPLQSAATRSGMKRAERLVLSKCCSPLRALWGCSRWVLVESPRFVQALKSSRILEFLVT